MDTKEKLLHAVASALEAGTITGSDLQAVIHTHSTKSSTEAPSTNRVSAVDIMFYIAGIVLFAAIAALITQSWDSGAEVRILLSAGLGTVCWMITIYLIHLAKGGDIRSGMTNALLVTGSLSLITGGFITANEFVDFDNPSYYAIAATLFLLGVLHIVFGRQIRRDLLVLLGVLLSVAAFPTLVIGLLDGSDLPMFVTCLVIAVSGGLLAYTTRAVSRIGLGSAGMARAFDSLSAFTVLMSLYAASYDNDTGLLWLFILIIGIVGLFYLSIIMQNKLMLGNGSLFLVITVITISVRFFSGYGIPVSLLIGAFGLLGTAIVAATINRRYIK